MNTETREAAGLPERGQRYVTDDVSLHEVSDPDTREDESKRGLKEWIHDHPYLAIFAVVLTPVTLLILLVLVERVAPAVIGNPFVQGGTVLVTYTALVAWVARRNVHATRNQIHELRLAMPNDRQQTYLGTFDTSIDGDPRYLPMKGFGRFGRRGDPYTYGELSAELGRKVEREGGSADDPAYILLRPEYTWVSRSEYGTHVTQLTDGLTVNASGEYTVLEASKPRMADKDALKDANTTIDQLEDENQDLKGSITQLRRQKRDAEQEAKKRREKIVQEFLHNYKEAAEAEGQRRRPRVVDSSPSPGRNGQSAAALTEEYLDDD